ncbi:hypothetical protein ASPACDRAFT_60471 [Aspergillus aculeatus ATCC 16872]|uniref:Uncharacterized protein n=1 Tax=Aspergillus aculeatus (strain ATCC 16872 / CBS 172.66 / WB 5094) TaxID=690307 RepID=A0A1L9WTX5_ASPA1|nr:uncharacterized protein ASPACDRAFT_60471 [Aspergillus aculeatus ATCC 16872]OJJ99631.1 hypothetical protein ASPACDRAFT_60471 [Aspergillus aculeatus ATCC 16872]
MDTAFEFVNLTSAQQLRQKPTRAVIRSHASRHNWRSHANSNATKRPSYTPKDDRPQQTLAEMHSISEAVGLGLLDPFQTYPSQLDAATVSRMFEYSLQYLWPTIFMASAVPEQTSPTIRAWFTAGLNSPVLFSAFIHGAATHLQSKRLLSGAQQVDQKAAYEIQLSQLETVQRLNAAMQRPVDQWTDEVILAINSLLYTSDDAETINAAGNVSSPFSPVFESMQSLDVYAVLTQDNCHRRGLLAMIRQRGGLENIKLEGVAAVISSTEVIVATKNLTKPQLEYRSMLSEQLHTTQRESPTPSFQSTALELSQNRLLDQLKGFPRGFLEILHDMVIYTDRIQSLIHGRVCQSHPQMLSLVEQRNWIQHRLLSLPSKEKCVTPVSFLYEPFRLAAQVYSLAVILPLPMAVAPFARLAELLQVEISQAMEYEPVCSDAEVDLLLWMVVLGGIASEGTRVRSWYETMLRHLLQGRDFLLSSNHSYPIRKKVHPERRMLKLLAQPFHPLTLPAPTSFANQTLLITGANTGVGLEAARHALTLHAAKVILGVRDLTKGEAAKADLLSTTGAHSCQIDLWALDLASFASVKAFVARVRHYVRDEQGRIDVAIMNAGLASGEWHVTEDGWERTIQVNGLATALLSLRVLNVLLAQAKQDETMLPHLVIVASDVHMSAGFAERQEENTLAALNDQTQWARSAAANGPAERYAVSKLLDVYLMLELAGMVPRKEDAARTPWVVVNAVTPGFCKSELLTREKAPLALRVMQWLTGRTTQEGGKALIDAAARGVDSHGEWLENQVVADPGEIVTSKEGVRTRKKVWREMLEVLRKVDPDLPRI